MCQTPLPDDADLVSRCRAGDGAAWGQLVNRYQRLVHLIVRRAGLDEHTAADVFQTVFLRLLQHLPHLAQPSRLKGWIIVTTQREAWLQAARSRRMVSMTTVDSDGRDAGPDPWDREDSAPGPQDTLQALQELAQAQEALDRLDPRCRDLLRALFAPEPLGYHDIARQLRMPVGSIGPTRARCLGKLRETLDQAGGRPAPARRRTTS